MSDAVLAAMPHLIKDDSITLEFALAPKTDAPVYRHPETSPLSVEGSGHFVRTQDGALLRVSEWSAHRSSDEGRTWQRVSLFSEQGAFKVQPTHSLAVTRSGTVVLAFLNTAQAHFRWLKSKNRPTRNTRLPLCVMRSEDHGRTWSEPQTIQTGYCGASFSLVQTASGRLVLSAQNLDYTAGRHYSLSYVSDDDGHSWQASNWIDLGGQGHHDGVYEGCLLPLKDGRLWYCLRTNHDWFYNAYSEDEGLTWTHMEPGMTASSSPAYLLRLQSGRILMLYNPLRPSSGESAARISGQFSQRTASWYRAELVARLSDDDAQSWTDPVTLAYCQGAWLAYPRAFEQRPGHIWIDTMQSGLKLTMDEAMLLQN
ncbi:sialidase family protein [Thiomicrospira sp. WB1]|uniref:sialidase family protein n=1 Tax=Thiomicrospira sp. WB1 TaxID=1685380 RepID=UPI00074830C2|nr:sialidase family protein [Thiomicrospira sp. WB1]KUJ72130.1 sialidase [Thiomicrospira sp. WB1]